MANREAFRAMLQRAPPQNEGEVEWPAPKSNSLTGKKFLFTGILETIRRDPDLEAVVKNSGGHVLKSVSGQVDYFVVGRDAGPSKLQKAEKLGLKALSEMEFHKILTRMLGGGAEDDDDVDGSSSSAKERKSAKKPASSTKSKKTTSGGKRSRNEVVYQHDDDSFEDRPKKGKKSASGKKSSKSRSNKGKKQEEEKVAVVDEDDSLGQF